MTPLEREPTPDELCAMAYVDGELDAAERAALEARLESDEALAREVAELRGLELIARQMAPPEPIEHEWRRIQATPTHRWSQHLGLVATGIGIAGLGIAAVFQVVTDPGISLLLKLLGASLGIGLSLLFLGVLRARMQSLPLDPYTQVRR